MADSYRLAAGLVIFILFLSSGLLMLGDNFPETKPAGVPSASQLQQVTATPLFGTAFCVSGDWLCGASNFFANIANGLVIGALYVTAMGGFFIGLLTFQIPAFQANPFTQLINLLIILPIVTVIALFIFRMVKSVIPTIGGDTD